jgi:hypothetical protein
MAARRALSLTSWFHSPLIEMGQQHEVLSRASCFAVQSRSRFIVASQHVVFPFLYPAYYPEDTHGFVHALEPTDIRLTVELRDRNGAVLRQAPLSLSPIGHPSRDFVIIPVSEDAAVLRELLQDVTWPIGAIRSFNEGSDNRVGCEASVGTVRCALVDEPKSPLLAGVGLPGPQRH